MYEKQKTEETFAPVINHRRGDNLERRNLDKFLKDQNNFSKKIKKKREEILNEKIENNKKTNIGKPQVDKNSEELAKKLNNTEQPAYLRLYNKRTLEQDKKAEKEKLYKERKKEEEQKRKEIADLTAKKEELTQMLQNLEKDVESYNIYKKFIDQVNAKYSNDNTNQNDLYDNLKEKFEQLMNHEIEIQKIYRRTK